MAALPRRIRLSLPFLASLVLGACGGGSNSGGDAGVNTGPTITQQPQNQTAKPGASATFTGAATASTTPTYQWERSPDNSAWTAISGATDATYSFTAQAVDNRAWFRFKASSGGITTTSSEAQLTVTTASAVWRIEGSLWGLALDATGNLFAVDSFGSLVKKVSPTGTVLTQWGGLGSATSEFSFPKYAATDATGAVFVADTRNSRIQKFTSAGAFVLTWGTYGQTVGNTPAPDGTFNGPTGIAVDTVHGWVYVVDSNNNRVQKFDLSGTFLAKWGTSGTGNGEFRFIGPGQGPEGGIAVDATGNVYVVDNMNWRVQKFSSDGTYLSQFGTQGTGAGQFSYPSGIAVDSAHGYVYVVDNTTNGNLPGNVCTVTQFSLAGAYVSSWQPMSLDGTPEAAIGVAVDAAGNVYLTQGASIGRYVP